jgi:hypothetical protein
VLKGKYLSQTNQSGMEGEPVSFLPIPNFLFYLHRKNQPQLFGQVNKRNDIFRRTEILQQYKRNHEVAKSFKNKAEIEFMSFD